MEMVHAPTLLVITFKCHEGTVSFSMASPLEHIPFISPQELGYGSQQSKGHSSAFTLV